MPKLKNYGPGRRFNIWVPEKHLDMWMQIENRSKFVQIALSQAVGIMQWAILKERQPEIYRETSTKLEAVLDEYNTKFPLDPLTKQRIDNERVERSDPGDSSQPNTELW